MQPNGLKETLVSHDSKVHTIHIETSLEYLVLVNRGIVLLDNTGPLLQKAMTVKVKKCSLFSKYIGNKHRGLHIIMRWRNISQKNKGKTASNC